MTLVKLTWINPHGGASMPSSETFPTLTAREMERLRRYGTPHKFADGEKLFQTGKRVPGAFLALSGVVAVSERDGLGHSTPIVEEGVGQFLGEVGLLAFGKRFAGRRNGRG